MNQESRLKKLEESEIIESIIFAFEGRVLYDIKHNLDRPELVGLLTASLMERYCGYLFAEEADKVPDKFVEAYMPDYKDIGLYQRLKNILADKLVDALKAVISEDRLSIIRKRVGLQEYRMLNEAFVEDFEIGLKMASKDLRNNEDQRQVAISWFREHPVALLGRWSWYSNEEMSEIYDYYIPLIQSHPLFKDESRLSVGLNFGDKGYWVSVIVDDCFGRKGSIRIPLELFIGLMDLKSPAELLGWEDQPVALIR